MALFPCRVGMHHFKGKSNTVYVGLVHEGTDGDRYKLRFCDRHLLEVYEYLSQFKVLIEDDAVSTNGTLETCLACGKPATEVDWKLFVTVYPSHQEREDYWCQLHVNHEMQGYLQR